MTLRRAGVALPLVLALAISACEPLEDSPGGSSREPIDAPEPGPPPGAEDYVYEDHLSEHCQDYPDTDSGREQCEFDLQQEAAEDAYEEFQAEQEAGYYPEPDSGGYGYP